MSEYPYPGLRPFQRNETDIFFGRENHSDDLVEKLKQTHFLAVLGSSGCGKSSLVRTGLLPSLDSGFMSGAGAYWAVAVMRPGNQPFANLAKCLLEDNIFANHYSLSKQDPDFAQNILEAELSRGPLSLHEILESYPLPDDCQLHIVVDQFEEIFRYQRDISRQYADAFVALLLQAHKHEKIYITITMRSDFIGNCSTFLGLPEAINRGLFLTPRLSRDELADVIRLPARVFDGDVEPALVNHLLNEISSGQQDQLPLLQHTLMRMWNLDDDKILTLPEYRQLGGLQRTLSDHADKAYKELSEKQQKIAEIMFRRLTEGAIDLSDTRNPTTVENIMQLARVESREVAQVIDVFRKPSRCFLLPGVETKIKPDTLIDISHESLIRQWKRLHQWAEDEANLAELYKRLAKAALRWKNKQGELWHGVDLQQAQSWLNKPEINSDWASRYNAQGALDFKIALEFLLESEKAETRIIEERKRRKIRELNRLRYTAWGSSLSIIILILSVSTINYLYFRPHVSYFDSFTKQWGLPIGHVELNDEQQKHRSITFKFTRKGSRNQVDSIEAIDSPGQCTTSHQIGTYIDWVDQIDEKSKACRWVFIRDANDNIVYEKAFDKRDNLVWGLIYYPPDWTDNQVKPKERRGQFVSADGFPSPQKESKATFVRIEHTDEGYDDTVWYTDRTGSPALGPDKQFALRYQYNEQGQKTIMTSLDKKGDPMNDSAGNASQKIAYNAQGFPFRYTFLDVNDKIITIDTGYAITEYKHDDAGNILEVRNFNEQHLPVAIQDGYHKLLYKYDNKGNVSEYSYYDINSKPALSARGIHLEKVLYDERNNAIDVSYYDTGFKPVISSNGYARFTQFFDDNSRPLMVEFFNTNSQTTLGKGGYGVVEYGYDANGNQIFTEYLDANEQPVTLSSGYSTTITQYDCQNRLLEKHYLDADLNPVITDQGYASYRNTYDKSGNRTKGEYFGLNGENILSKDGYAAWQSKYDQSGNQTLIHYFGTDGKAKAIADGYAFWRMDYDDRGNNIRESYFDTAGQPYMRADGYSVIESKYNSAGNEIERDYRNSTGQPATIKSGYTRWKAEYNSRGKQTQISYYDIKDRLVNTHKNYAKITRDYNYMSQLTHEAYFNQYDQPVLFGDFGYASKLNTYNQRGDNIETRYFGINTERVKISTGYFRVAREFDIFGHNTKLSYFDINNKPTNSTEDFAILTKSYNSLGQLETQRVFDTNEIPINDKTGLFHQQVNHYNAQGKLETASYFNVNLKPTMHNDGYHQEKYFYNNQGKSIRTEYLDTHLKPVNIKTGCAIWLYRYDTLGHNLEINTLNTKKEPCDTNQGYSRVINSYDLRGRKTGVAVFDSKGLSTRHPEGWFSWSEEFDQAGNVVKRTYLGADKKPMVLQNGYAFWMAKYNAFGKNTEISYFDENGNATIDTSYNLHRYVFKYNKNQQRIEISSYGVDNKLIMNKHRYARMTSNYNRFGNMIEEIYYDENNELTEVDGCKRQLWIYDERGYDIDYKCEQ